MTDYDASTIERFWAKVDRRGPDDCWEWTASRTPDGYGQIKLFRSRKVGRAHVIAFDITNSGVRNGRWVLHHCDNPPCCNPKHLYAGTIVENTADKVARGRSRSGPVRGQDNGNAKLDAMQVIEIRGLIAAGLNNCQIARRYGVTHAMISRIRLGKSWARLW